jgi:hypothetical protein
MSATALLLASVAVSATGAPDTCAGQDCDGGETLSYCIVGAGQVTSAHTSPSVSLSNPVHPFVPSSHSSIIRGPAHASPNPALCSL